MYVKYTNFLENNTETQALWQIFNLPKERTTILQHQTIKEYFSSMKILDKYV